MIIGNKRLVSNHARVFISNQLTLSAVKRGSNFNTSSSYGKFFLTMLNTHFNVLLILFSTHYDDSTCLIVWLDLDTLIYDVCFIPTFCIIYMYFVMPEECFERFIGILFTSLVNSFIISNREGWYIATIPVVRCYIFQVVFW